ncbi:hypothetical protein P691DRAFT_769050 [Macrolepiota fuliginosa MF-IS2]|uniref:Uncharacterized protein n=1 Tax=Macrolepiota fuliginosa MF-IS2 TaxID=1400762 RepID=A0A9P5WW42_9AGAR|nr:hypothetical protein P691DRAFT_769050 [Macrolepiota fuliginosa MF-IS2]
MHDAREGLKRVCYDSQIGIQGYYDAIMENAQCMTVHPDDYTLIEVFLEGIPADMKTDLLFYCGLTPEVNSLEDFMTYAVSYENRWKTASFYQKALMPGGRPVETLMRGA